MDSPTCYVGEASAATRSALSVPVYTSDAGPVMRMLQSSPTVIRRSPPGAEIVIMRSGRARRTDAAATALALVPDAIVSPAPRSQIKIRRWSRAAPRAHWAVGRLGNAAG